MTERSPKYTCVDHNDGPSGYLGWHEWADKKSKTHRQVRCDECGRYHIWIKKAVDRG